MRYVEGCLLAVYVDSTGDLDDAGIKVCLNLAISLFLHLTDIFSRVGLDSAKAVFICILIVLV
eukprot:12374891-Ditylum_brightwellii.AAC.1